MSSDDPLLSVSQVARMWGTGLNIVVELVKSETLPALDRLLGARRQTPRQGRFIEVQFE